MSNLNADSSQARKALVRCGVGALLLGLAVSTIAYVLVSPEFGHGNESALAWLLWPGVWLYIQLNGSLVFGGGFGTCGNAAIFIVGSGIAWSVPFAGALWCLTKKLRPQQGFPCLHCNFWR